MTCTCHNGGYHDPANYECDQAILDGTAGPAYAEAPIAEHRLVTVDDEPGAYMGRCSCGALVQSRSVNAALVEHLQDVRAGDVTVRRCQHVSPSPWGPTQCALPEGHAERHAYSPSEEAP